MDFRLRVFVAVAQNLSFTKAAQELNISQPAISKHIQELEAMYGVQLFERVGNKIKLTAGGNVFLKHAISIIESYRGLELDMSLHSGKYSGVLRIGASTTIAQYLLPKLIAKFLNRFPDIRFTMLSGNSEQIEQDLSAHRIDVGLIEGDSHHVGFRYIPIAKDELVLVTSTRNNVKDEISVEELKTLPLVVREDGSGTLEVMGKALARHGIKLSEMNIMLKLGSTESIKSFLINCTFSYAIISIAALTDELKQDKLKVIEINGMTMEREFSFVTHQGAQNELSDRFVNFVDNEKL